MCGTFYVKLTLPKLTLPSPPFANLSYAFHHHLPAILLPSLMIIYNALTPSSFLHPPLHPSLSLLLHLNPPAHCCYKSPSFTVSASPRHLHLFLCTARSNSIMLLAFFQQRMTCKVGFLYIFNILMGFRYFLSVRLP